MVIKRFEQTKRGISMVGNIFPKVSSEKALSQNVRGSS